jgi:hypothetical protein
VKRLFFITATLAMALLCAAHAQTQTITGTNLIIRANWDTGSPVDGVVTFGHVNPTGPATILVTRNLSKGRAAFQTVLATNSIYQVILTGSDGTQLTQFPVTTALINPANLDRAGITLVFNSSDKSLKSASVNVDLNF